MIDLGVPNEKILLGAQQTIYMVGISLIIEIGRASCRERV